MKNDILKLIYAFHYELLEIENVVFHIVKYVLNLYFCVKFVLIFFLRLPLQIFVILL